MTEVAWCKSCGARRKVEEIFEEGVLTGPREETVFEVVAMACGHDNHNMLRTHYVP